MDSSSQLSTTVVCQTPWNDLKGLSNRPVSIPVGPRFPPTESQKIHTKKKGHWRLPSMLLDFSFLRTGKLESVEQNIEN